MSKTRRKFTDDFKAEVVGLCLVGDRSVGQVARDLGISVSVVQRWVQMANFPVLLLCKVLRVSRSGFYAVEPEEFVPNLS